MSLVSGEYPKDYGALIQGEPVRFAGWIEDSNRSWIMYLDENWRPAILWLNRDDTGGVLGDPIEFGSDDLADWPVE